ncbi:hypothetical protein [Lactococcus phage P1048]|uniref:Uncharacterized protein n=1 Tax=Lactococcus phage P1048 TaxID=2662295 RepID=A0A649V2U4_9CAUD|nr:hypothetical protein H1Z36_gp166 [Lactococcus phage P1048]QGJ84962.1 hypothetical protein [Lactococcus phage P1048]
MKRIKTQTISFDMNEVKALTGFTLKNSWGNYVLEHEKYGVIHDVVEGEDGESWTNGLFNCHMTELEGALRHYVHQNFSLDYFDIVQNGRFEYDTVGHTVQFHSENEVTVYFILEDEKYWEVS